MEKDPHKRLEEAAENYAEKHGFRVPYDGSNNFYDETDVKASKDGFLAGAMFGYKEAIAQAKDWLKDNLGYYDYDAVYIGETCWEHIAKNFEAEMNKLWEDNYGKN